MSIGCLVAFLMAASALIARAQTPSPVIIPPSGPDEITVELPKGEPPLVEEDTGDQVAVVPAGQEGLFADMLGRGAALPGGCALSAGQIDGETVRATYTCPAGEVVFELMHPDKASRDATKMERFAIALKSGSPPEGFAADLASRIRTREASFEWKWLGQPRARRSFRSSLLLAGVGVLAIAVVLVAWRARRR